MAVQQSRYLSLPQAAALAGVSRQALHKQIQAGRLRVERCGHRFLVRRSQLLTFMRRTGRVAVVA